MAPATRLEQAFRHDRIVVIAAIAVVAAMAWLYVIWLASPAKMSAMDMPAMMEPGIAPWSTADVAFTFVMWAVMMLGMMLPSASPMVLLYARVARQALERGAPFAATGWFAAGYVVSWTGFALIATAAQWGLEQAAVLSSTTLRVDRDMGGLLLVAAGLYQWTPFKDACLTQCQAPLVFIQRHGGFRKEPLAALTLGVRHGLYCIGCCWMLMALLFAGGIMNVLWIAAIAAFVLLEKLVPPGRGLSRLAGTALMIAGVWMVL
jgi:predicted metal-binding membrane protein